MWDPYHQCDIDKPENTQRGAARFCNNDYMYRHTSSVTAMIKDLEWDSIGFLPQKSSVVHHEQGTHNIIHVNKDVYLKDQLGKPKHVELMILNTLLNFQGMTFISLLISQEQSCGIVSPLRLYLLNL